MSQLKVLELFAGSRSIGKICDKRGHTVFSTDLEPFKKINLAQDILEFDYDAVPFIPDRIWASPPCTFFSVASIGHHWVQGEKCTPKTDAAVLGIKILDKTLEIINHYLALNPNLVYFIENPRGKMRKLPQMEVLPRHTVTYCQYGDTRMKPTDIWTNSETWVPKPMCKNGDPCHTAAPRGSRTGTQGIVGAYNRSKIPKKLCKSIVKSWEIENGKEKSGKGTM